MPLVTEKLGEVAGRARAAAAVLLGQRGVLRSLKLDHGEMRVLLKRMARTEDPQTRGELMRLVNAELLAHAEAEEATLYRALTEHDMTEPLATLGKQEHQQMRWQLQHLQSLPTDDAEWKPQAERLARLFQKHVDYEEGKVFVLAQDVLETADFQRLQSEFEALKLASLRRLTSELAGESSI